MPVFGFPDANLSHRPRRGVQKSFTECGTTRGLGARRSRGSFRSARASCTGSTVMVVVCDAIA
jgi:hypothetical protein